MLQFTKTNGVQWYRCSLIKSNNQNILVPLIMKNSKTKSYRILHNGVNFSFMCKIFTFDKGIESISTEQNPKYLMKKSVIFCLFKFNLHEGEFFFI